MSRLIVAMSVLTTEQFLRYCKVGCNPKTPRVGNPPMALCIYAVNDVIDD